MKGSVSLEASEASHVIQAPSDAGWWKRLHTVEHAEDMGALDKWIEQVGTITPGVPLTDEQKALMAPDKLPQSRASRIAWEQRIEEIRDQIYGRAY